MSVRLARIEDLASVIAIERSAVEAPHWPAMAYRAALTGMGTGQPARQVFLWEGAGGVAGFAVGMVLGTEGARLGEIEIVAVLREARRGGIARALCLAVSAWCEELGASEIGLEVRASSAGAIALYAGLGFVVVGRRRQYYAGPIEDAVAMRLDLSRPPVQ